jgi:hypothetical protein
MITLSLSYSSVTYRVYEFSTRTVVLVRTVVSTVVNIPVYIRTVLAITVVRIPLPTDEATGMSTALLLGISGGGATMLAILIGIVVFIVRHRAGLMDEDSYQDGEVGNETSFSSLTAFNGFLPNRRKSTDDAQNLGTNSSEPLSGCEGDEPEDGGLYI